MNLTGIGVENLEAFMPLMNGNDIADYSVAIGAIEDDRAVGVALYNDFDDALMLDYIFVAPSYRRRGIGTALINDFLEEIKDLEPSALHVNYPEKSEEMHGFFAALGFMIFRDGYYYRVKTDDFLKSRAIEKLVKGSSKHQALPVSKLSDRQKQIIRKAMSDEDLDPTIIDDGSLSDELSLVTLDSDQKPVACILSNQSGKEIALLYLVNFSKDASQLADILRVYSHTIRDRYSDNELLFVTMNEKMRQFAENLLDDPKALIDEGNVVSGIKMITEDE